jgi:hypothetical protein
MASMPKASLYTISGSVCVAMRGAAAGHQEDQVEFLEVPDGAQQTTTSSTSFSCGSVTSQNRPQAPAPSIVAAS